MNKVTFSADVKTLLKLVYIEKVLFGLAMGLYLYTWAYLIYEKISSVSDNTFAISMTAFLLGLNRVLIFLLEIPTGALGDAVGRKKTVLLSYLSYAAFFLLMGILALSNQFYIIVIFAILAQFFLALCGSFYSGSFVAWLSETLLETDHTIGYEEIHARGNIFQTIGFTLGGIVGIGLYIKNLSEWTFFSGAIVSVIAYLFLKTCLTESHTSRSIKTKQHLKNSMKEIIKTSFECFRKSHALIAITAIISFFGLAVKVIDSFWPIYIQDNFANDYKNLLWMGIAFLTGILGVSSAYLYSFMTNHYRRKHGRKMDVAALRKQFLLSNFLTALPVFFISAFSFFQMDHYSLIVTVMIVITYTEGFVWPSYFSIMNHYIPKEFSNEKATILSFASLVTSLVIFLLAIPSAGTSSDNTTIAWSLPALLLLLSVIFGNSVLKREEKKFLQ